MVLNGTNEDNIDLFLLKNDLELNQTRAYTREARMRILNLIKKYKIGFDILSAPTKYIEQREDYFYKVDILENGKVWYE